MSRRAEDAIMWCLLHAPEGMWGPQICRITGIWRSNIYRYLNSLEDRGFVRHEVRTEQHGILWWYANIEPLGWPPL